MLSRAAGSAGSRATSWPFFSFPPAGVHPITTLLLPTTTRHRILTYLAALTVLVSLAAPSGGVIDIPISFLLKNRLHLDAHQVASFRLIAAIPLYLSGVFGFLRDTWHPFGMRDRGFMCCFGILCAMLYLICAFLPITASTLLAAIILLTSCSLFVASAQSGLTAAIGQQHLITGQVSTIWNVFSSVPTVAALLFGGALSAWLETMPVAHAGPVLFLTGAALMVVVAIVGGWEPRSVAANVRPEDGPRAHPLDDLRRLARHKPIYPALLIFLLWNFAPGANTPLQFYLQDTLHAGDAQWGEWNAIFAASFMPTFLLYGFLCPRLKLRTLLRWGTVFAVPQMVPLLLIHSVAGALLAAIPIGLMGGVATAAYIDLLIRSCPRGLQGTVLMLSGALNVVASRFGDVLGTELYERAGGFSVCVIAITIVYAAILPLLATIRPGLVSHADGHPSAA